MQVHGHALAVTPSLGIACYPEDGASGERLLKHADIALYRTKAAGRAGFTRFDWSMVDANGLRTDPAPAR